VLAAPSAGVDCALEPHPVTPKTNAAEITAAKILFFIIFFLLVLLISFPAYIFRPLFIGPQVILFMRQLYSRPPGL
jgi:hypothetical protein